MKTLLFLLLPIYLFAQLDAIDNKLLFLKYDTGVTTDVGGVSLWADQSGNSKDFNQSSDVRRPDYPSSAYLDFVSSTFDWLERNDDAAFSFGNGTIDSPFSIMSYVYMDDADNFIIFCKADAFPQLEYAFTVLSPSHNLRLNLFDDNTTAYRRKVGTTDLSLSETNWISLGCTYDGTTIKLYINGSEETGTSTEAGYTAMSNTTALEMIGKFNTASTYANGRFQYLLVTTDVLTPTEMSNIQTYFATGTYPVAEETQRDKEFKERQSRKARLQRIPTRRN